jgi:hypothetical protein
MPEADVATKVNFFNFFKNWEKNFLIRAENSKKC